MIDLNKYKSFRLNPSQARGKERIRVILAASLQLFREQGVDHVTTNDIAEYAHIPIGSVYRYFKNKDEIILALLELYAEDITAMLKSIAEHPLLPMSSWQEIMIIVTDSWAHYARINGSFAFLSYVESNPGLYERSEAYRQRVISMFSEILAIRSDRIDEKQAAVACRLIWTSVEQGAARGDDYAREAARAVALYLEKPN